MTSLSELTYRLNQRPTGSRKIPRVYPEWIVDGVPLVDLLVAQARANGFDTGLHMLSGKIPPMIWFHGDEATARLLTELPPDLPSGRYSLLVCPECGDAGCGVISAVIEGTDNVIVWRDFGSETDYYDPTEPEFGWFDVEELASIGPFAFDREQYEQTIREMQRVGFDAYMKWRALDGR